MISKWGEVNVDAIFVDGNKAMRVIETVESKPKQNQGREGCQ
jgi:hypothetical protein